MPRKPSSSAPDPSKLAPSPGTGPSLVQRALRKLGLLRDIDFALYLPMRYEDETRIVRLADLRDGDMGQIEAAVTESEVSFRPRRQLVVTVDDGSDTCQLRFFNFYPSQQKQLAVGARVRVRGEVRGGFLGRQMMHPTVKAAGTVLPDALTPVYSTIAGLAQPVLRREVRAGLARAVLDETVPAQIGLRGAWPLRDALNFLHYPTPDVSIAALEDHSHPAWQRLKAEELLAQQLSQLQARRERAAQRALAGGMTLAGTLQMVREFRTTDQDTPLILMGYMNLLVTMGFKAFAQAAGDAGVDGIIIVDCPPEEADPMADALDAADISLIRLATPTTDDKRLPTVLRRTSGFVYYVSVAGVTGVKEADAAAVAPHVERIRKASGLPVAVGFGIKTEERAEAIAKVADAVVVGSALVDEVAEAVANNESVTTRVLLKVETLSKAVRFARVGVAV